MHDGLSWTLVVAALGIAVVHTAIGPDHYLPFIALAEARRWSRRRMLVVTGLCGLAHVGSSLALAALAILAGASLGLLKAVEEGRGAVAAWVLLAFGLAYGAWGVRRALRERRGIVLHQHHGHVHLHAHGEHAHSHARDARDATTFWTLFAVFVLGPCEPLIPLVFLPAASGRWALAGAISLVFGVATVLTMLVLVGAARAGIRRLPTGALERWAHAAAGLVLSLSGLAMLFGL